MAGGAVGDAEQPNRRHRQQPQRFHQHAGLRIDSDFLAHQTIKGKAEGQPQADNRQRTKGPELHQHAAKGEDHRQPLQATETFAKENHP